MRAGRFLILCNRPRCRGFFHPAARHELLWDLTQAPGLRARTHHIEEAGRRRVVEEVLEHFDAEVLPELAGGAV
ncbi:MAG: hypothetical protein E2P02_08010 [Acidobacteria bacterium]|nr:MAG: hypothetical protein E2P02_08010 [Acidobacteriota bacterium]